ncbi:transposase [Geobacter pickeringii]|uniref:Transposase n=1 Tax=Geobacter pickeringii TaxID=345632 RepID=A0A0B5BDU4_9BACT|nr:transposase [Geobacter pickeringii]AJE02705.1 transposase [Geobacter pickeringii]
MARIARVIAAGIPHHVTQRGNRRMQTFFGDDDYRAYISLLSEWCRKCSVAIWAYCLMPNHVHLIAVPESEDALRRGIGEAHRRYSRMVNFRENWRGHLWQGRFASFPMDETYLLAAARYVEMNPVVAGLAEGAAAWPWSSARAHLAATDDELVTVAPLLEIAGDWRLFLSEKGDDGQADDIRKHERTGRPLGSEVFVEQLEMVLDRPLKRGKPGPKGEKS